MSSRVPLPWRRVGKVGTTWRSRAGWGCWRGGCGRRRRVCSNSRWMRHVLIQLVMPKLSCCEKWNHENNFHKRLGVKIGINPIWYFITKTSKTSIYLEWQFKGDLFRCDDRLFVWMPPIVKLSSRDVEDETVDEDVCHMAANRIVEKLLCPRLGKGCQSYNMNHNP